MVWRLCVGRAHSSGFKRSRVIPRRTIRWFVACGLLACAMLGAAQTRVLVDDVGYETASAKKALIVGTEQDPPLRFALIDDVTGKTAVSSTLILNGPVDHWGGRIFWTADFTAWQKAGHYRVRAETATGETSSSVFAIEDNLLERETLSNVVYYFKGQRSSGLFDEADRHLTVPSGPGFVDLHGGWYDATGD